MEWQKRLMNALLEGDHPEVAMLKDLARQVNAIPPLILDWEVGAVGGRCPGRVRKVILLINGSEEPERGYKFVLQVTWSRRWVWFGEDRFCLQDGDLFPKKMGMFSIGELKTVLLNWIAEKMLQYRSSRDGDNDVVDACRCCWIEPIDQVLCEMSAFRAVRNSLASQQGDWRIRLRLRDGKLVLVVFDKERQKETQAIPFKASDTEDELVDKIIPFLKRS